MEYEKDGKQYEISYSQVLQQQIIDELQKSQALQRNNQKLMKLLIIVFIIILILAIVIFLYLNQRDMITYTGRLIFCRSCVCGL